MKTIFNVGMRTYDCALIKLVDRKEPVRLNISHFILSQMTCCQTINTVFDSLAPRFANWLTTVAERLCIR